MSFSVIELDEKYQNWIDAYPYDIKGKSKEVSEEMQKIFPELKIAKGLIQLRGDNKWYLHYWLWDKEGFLIDPTEKQYEDINDYDEVGDLNPFPTGICENCCAYCFNNEVTCSDRCHNELNNPLRTY